MALAQLSHVRQPIMGDVFTEEPRNRVPSWLMQLGATAIITIILGFGSSYFGEQRAAGETIQRINTLERQGQERAEEHDKFLTKEVFEANIVPLRQDVKDTKEAVHQTNNLAVQNNALLGQILNRPMVVSPSSQMRAEDQMQRLGR